MADPFSLAGRTALVTGAGNGIGAAVARAFATAGAAVVVTDVDKDAAAAVADAILQSGGRAESAVVDVRDAEQAAAAAEQAANLGDGRLNILVNNAGAIAPAMFAKMTPEQFQLVLGIHVGGTFTVSQAALPFLAGDGTGRIINVTSAATLHEPGPVNSAYGTSKAALNQFTRHLAAEIAGSGVTANVIHPGDVKTDMWADIRNGVADLGPIAERYREWAAWVESTGGDDP